MEGVGVTCASGRLSHPPSNTPAINTNAADRGNEHLALEGLLRDCALEFEFTFEFHDLRALVNRAEAALMSCSRLVTAGIPRPVGPRLSCHRKRFRGARAQLAEKHDHLLVTGVIPISKNFRGQIGEFGHRCFPEARLGRLWKKEVQSDPGAR